MATKREPKKAATRKRTSKRSNSNISAAQKATAAKRAEAKKAEQSKNAQSESARKARLAALAKQKEASGENTKLEPRNGPMATRGAGVDQEAIARRDSDATPGFKAGTQAANKIAGLATGLKREQAAQRTQANIQNPNPLADASNYGTNNKARADRLTALMNAQNAAQTKRLTTAGKAVWMGAKMNRAKIRNSGPERLDPEGIPGRDYTQQAVGDDIRSTDELMSWLADEKTFNQIRDAAKKAGMDVQSYDDVAKLWEQVVKQAAATYSSTGKKVTPWALMSLRGKSMVNGKPAAKTTISTNIDELDPAQAKVMIKNSLQQALGRDPRQDEIDDFIAKAQTIAKQNPQVTKTTTQYDFAGNPTSQSSTSKGGGDVVTAKAQLAAEQAAEDAPDYAQYQAAGVYAPWMFEALSSPI